MTTSARLGPSRPSSALALWVAFAVGAAGVTALRPGLAAAFKHTKERDDVYVLPPPEELKASTLGYRAAVADMLWAKVLVEYGRHWADKRPFVDLEKYLDAILVLDPTFPALYRYVDTLLVFRPPIGTDTDARAARAYLERGLRERPYDPEVWLHYGQFVAFIAPTFLKSDDERERWRLEGSEAMVHAAELGAHVDRAITATSVLSRAGRSAVAYEMLQRAQALTDDPAILAEIRARIEQLERNQSADADTPARRAQRERRAAQSRIVDDGWRAQLPFVSRGEFMLLGPMPPPFTCTIETRHTRPECAIRWEDALTNSLLR